MLVLGLPAAGETFDEGQFVQQLSLSEIWLERGRINGADRLLMDWPLGLRALGHRVEPVMALLQAVWAEWRRRHWGLVPCAPRVWRT